MFLRELDRHMNEKNALIIEVLSGPLDGTVLEIKTEVTWTKMPGSSLSFPWDTELGEPQAVITPSENGWFLIPKSLPKAVYRINSKEIIKKKSVLLDGDVLKAGSTWLLVKKVT
jgi:hypothetical protein